MHRLDKAEKAEAIRGRHLPYLIKRTHVNDFYRLNNAVGPTLNDYEEY